MLCEIEEESFPPAHAYRIRLSRVISWLWQCHNWLLLHLFSSGVVSVLWFYVTRQQGMSGLVISMGLSLSLYSILSRSLHLH